jgi:hypothetical protein
MRERSESDRDDLPPDLISTVALARCLRFGEMIPEPFLTVYLIHRHQKPFKRFPFPIGVPNHRAEATVLMRSLRVTMLLFFREDQVTCAFADQDRYRLETGSS